MPLHRVRPNHPHQMNVSTVFFRNYFVGMGWYFYRILKIHVNSAIKCCDINNITTEIFRDIIFLICLGPKYCQSVISTKSIYCTASELMQRSFLIQPLNHMRNEISSALIIKNVIFPPSMFGMRYSLSFNLCHCPSFVICNAIALQKTLDVDFSTLQFWLPSGSVSSSVQLLNHIFKIVICKLERIAQNKHL